MYNALMTLTLQDVPKDVDDALRSKAQAEGKSVDQVALDVLKAGLGLRQRPKKHIDLSDIAGTWIEDPEVEAALRDQDRVDPEMWR
jgi:plasmid stability protein